MPSAKLAPHIAQKPRGAAKRECYPISDAQILRLLDGLPQTPSGECSCGAATRKRWEADRPNQENAGVPSSGVNPPAPPPRRSRGGPRTSGDWLRLALQGVGRPVSLV